MVTLSLQAAETFERRVREVSQRPQVEAAALHEVRRAGQVMTEAYLQWGAEVKAIVADEGEVKNAEEVTDAYLRNVLTICKHAVSCLLEAALDYWSVDAQLARQLVEWARLLIAMTSDIERVWPWTDFAAAVQAQAEYEGGELMDLETFANGLRGI